MPIKAKNFKLHIEERINNNVDKFFKSIEIALHYAGLNAVNTSRLQHRYTDRTGNLTSSVGYVIVHDGQIISSDFKSADNGTDKTTGLAKGKELAKEVAAEYANGYQLIIVAGMPYAVYVEAMGLDVLDSAEIQATQEVKEKINDVIRKWQL